MHKKYQEDYIEFARVNNKSKRTKLCAKSCGYVSNLCNLLLYKSHSSANKCFFIVPSLFNSTEILMFNQNDNFISYLRSFGDVYLIEWKQTNDNLRMIDYANEVTKIITFMKNKKVHLIGHCIGGNIAIISSMDAKISSLTLMTTPWDYSHLIKPMILSEYLNIRKITTGLKKIPKTYIQIMFFMLYPSSYEIKIAKYFALSDKHLLREKYLRIEHWLGSGIDLPSSLYNEILDEIIIDNKFMANELSVLAKISVPTCIIAATNDQIAPISSIAPLAKNIKNSTYLLIDGGHIGYLINTDQKFKKDYGEWLGSYF